MEKRKGNILIVINPGGSSTKLSLFTLTSDGVTETEKAAIRHPKEQLVSFKSINDQQTYRIELILNQLHQWHVKKEDVTAIAARGGPFKPLESGTYTVSKTVIEDVIQNRVQAMHPSNLGVLIADHIAQIYACDAFFVDPVSVDELDPIMRITGLPDISRMSLFHALNIKYVAHLSAEHIQKPLHESTMIISHLGSGVSIGLIRNGRIVDVNNSADAGPFSTQRAGGVPASQLVDLCYSQKYTCTELKDRLMAKSGFYSYLGTDELSEIFKQVDSCNAESTHENDARSVYQAFVYQVCSEIAARAPYVFGKVDAITLTGGMAHSERLTKDIIDRVSWIAPCLVFPGEAEMNALAEGVYRVLTGKEAAKVY